MRNVSRGAVAVLLAAGLLSGIGGAAGAASSKADDDILAKLKAIPGMTVQEKTSDLTGYRWFWLNYKQPVDHRDPSKGWFEQRVLLEHKSADRPMVEYTSGYNTPETMFLSEPTGLVDGNQISVEYRYFTPSRPEPAKWTKDNIWQAATDEHRIVQALKTIYHGKWINTGASKGGMTATYHKRFYPNDVDGTVAYVAPNDVNNNEDSAYDKFFKKVGTDPQCRTDLESLQREMLKRRGEMEAKMTADATAAGDTWTIIKTVDRAFENSVMDFEWAFWQYHLQAECKDIPKTTASTDDIYAYFDLISGAPDLHRPGPRRLHSVLLPGGHPARLAVAEVPAPAPAAPLGEDLPAAHVRAGRHPDALRPDRHEGRRQLGQAPREPHGLHLRPE